MKGKPVNQYDKDWVFMKRYPSIKDAAAETGVNAGNICCCCRGRMSMAKGFHWIYAYKAKYHPILIKRAKR
jgi:hypothetical protein